MVIREAGLVYKLEHTLVKSCYINPDKKKIFEMYRQILFKSLYDIMDNLFLTDTIEYFGGNKYILTYLQDKIRVNNEPDEKPIISYCIIDNRKNLKKYIDKVIIPLTKTFTTKFKETYEPISLDKISRYSKFSSEINEILGEETKTVDQKLRDSLF